MAHIAPLGLVEELRGGADVAARGVELGPDQRGEQIMPARPGGAGQGLPEVLVGVVPAAQPKTQVARDGGEARVPAGPHSEPVRQHHALEHLGERIIQPASHV
jgi:hypothetical protein